jgi:hypothetical protein
MAWLKMRQQDLSMRDLDEVRRRARDEWKAKFGPKDKPKLGN